METIEQKLGSLSNKSATQQRESKYGDLSNLNALRAIECFMKNPSLKPKEDELIGLVVKLQELKLEKKKQWAQKEPEVNEEWKKEWDSVNRRIGDLCDEIFNEKDQYDKMTETMVNLCTMNPRDNRRLNNVLILLFMYLFAKNKL